MSKCVKALYKSLSSFGLTEKEAQGIINEVIERVKAKEANGKVGQQDALNDSLNEILAEKKRIADIKRRQALISVKKNLPLKTKINEAKAPEKALSGILKKTEARRVGLMAQYFGDVDGQIVKEDLIDTLKDPTIDDELALAMFPGEQAPKTSPEVQKLAEIMKGSLEKLRRQTNRNGGAIDFLEEYLGTQVNDADKMISPTGSVLKDLNLRRKLFSDGAGNVSMRMQEIAKASWKKLMLENLDHARTFKPGQDIDKFMDEAWLNIITHRHFGHVGEEDFAQVYKPKSTLAGKISQQRVFFYKDGEAWSRVNKRYGSGSTRGTFFNSLTRGVQNLSLMDTFGPNPEGAFKALQEEVRNEYRTRGLAPDGVESTLHFQGHVWDELTGMVNLPAHKLGAKIGKSLRAWTSMIDLGSVAVTSMGDLATRQLVMYRNGVSAFDSYASALKGINQMFTSDAERKEFGAYLGVISDMKWGGMVSRFSGDEVGPGLTARAFTTYMKLTGLQLNDEVQKLSAATVLSKNLGENAHLEFSKLDLNLAHTLSQYDIGAPEWDLFRKDVFDLQGNNYITADRLNLKDEDIIQYLRDKEAFPPKKDRQSAAISEARERLTGDLYTYLADQAKDVTLNPDAFDKAFVRRGRRPGTVPGEAWRFLGQFKQYAVSFMRRGLHEAAFGDLPGAYKMGNFNLGVAASLFTQATILGYLSWAAKSMINSGTIPDFVTADSDQRLRIIREALLRGGGGGYYMSILFGIGGDLEDYVLKGSVPALDTVSNVVRFGYKIATWDHPGKALSDFIKYDTPYVNLFYTKYVLDYLILHDLAERSDPGAMQAASARYERQYNLRHVFGG